MVLDSSGLSTRGHIEMRLLIDKDSEARGNPKSATSCVMAFFVLLDGRGAYTSSQLSLTQLKRWSNMGPEGDGLWADHIAQEIQEAVCSPCRYNNDEAYQPALITVRDPALGAKLQRSATMRGLSCSGTEVRVVNASALVNGTPLVSIMDGLCANTIPRVNRETRTYLTEEEDLEKWGLDDAKVQSSKSDPDKYKLDKESEVRGVPVIVWACGGCCKLMYETKAKVYQKCKAIHYCSRACQVLDWKTGGHKASCQAAQEAARRGALTATQRADRDAFVDARAVIRSYMAMDPAMHQAMPDSDKTSYRASMVEKAYIMVGSLVAGENKDALSWALDKFASTDDIYFEGFHRLANFLGTGAGSTSFDPGTSTPKGG